MERTPVHSLVDAMLDEAERTHPGIEYTVILSAENSLLLPLHSTELRREIDGIDGYYRTHVYRDTEVFAVPEMIDWLVTAAPLLGRIPEAARATDYYGDLRTGEFGTTPPDPSELTGTHP